MRARVRRSRWTSSVCVVLASDGTAFPFEVDATRREALLKGLDDIGLTLRRAAEIAAFQADDRQQRPWVHEV